MNTNEFFTHLSPALRDPQWLTKKAEHEEKMTNIEVALKTGREKLAINLMTDVINGDYSAEKKLAAFEKNWQVCCDAVTAMSAEHDPERLWWRPRASAILLPP